MRTAAPYLPLPGTALLAIIIVFGTDVWRAVYGSIKGFCQAHLGDPAPGTIALAVASVLALAAIIAGIATALRELHRLRLLSRTLASARYISTWKGLHKYPSLLVEDARPFAFCHGLLRPRIYVSTSLAQLLTERELEAVLLHEEVHARRKDPLRLFGSRVLAGALFVLPLLRLVGDQYLVRLEVRADREVVNRVGVKPLAGALVKLLALPQSLPASPPAMSFNVTEERIKRLLLLEANPKAVPLATPRPLLMNSALVLGVGLLAAVTSQGMSMLLMSVPVCRVLMA
jgi:beta-lactamase regulating signal transducer with metallopeptidase domain